MVALAVLTQPAPNSLQAAYRRILFVVQSEFIPNPPPMTQPMYCDIYIAKSSGSWFYKTIIGYPGVSPYYTFDIQDAVQEALQTFIPNIMGTGWQESDEPDRTSQTQVYCKFRGSSYDANGLLIPEGPIPVQGTLTSAPVNGGGITSNTFYVLNASILPSVDSIINNRPQEILQLKQNLFSVSVDNAIYTLSNLPKTTQLSPIGDLGKCLPIYRDDFGQLPIIIRNFAPGGTFDPSFRDVEVKLWYQFNGVGTIFVASLVAFKVVKAGTYYLPVGLKNIAAINGTLADMLTDPSNNIYYHIAVLDLDLGAVCYISPKFKACTQLLERKRLWFQNMYGHFEQVTFGRAEENLITTSSEQFTPYEPVYTSGAPSQAAQALFMGHKRFNVRAHDEYTITGQFTEQLMPWLKELMMSPLCYVEDLDPLTGATILYNMKIVDGTFKTRKTVTDNRCVYEVSITVRQGIDYITLRN